MENFSISFNTVGSNEAALITGLTPAVQRDLRRPSRQILPPVEGHARYDVFDLCEMRAISAMADAGLNLKSNLHDAALIGYGMLNGVVTRICELHHGLDGDLDQLFNEEIKKQVEGSRLTGPVFDAVMARAALLKVLRAEWAERENPIAKPLDELVIAVEEKSSLICKANGTRKIGAYIEDASIKPFGYRQDYDGAVIVFDFQSLGAGLVMRADNAFWTSSNLDVPSCVDGS
jgi:hypothetical protein